MPSSARHRATQRRAARLGRDRRGVVMLELGLIGPVLIAMMLGFFEVGYDFFVVQSMDYATAEAARAIQTGSAQANSNVTDSASFQQTVMCPILAPLLSCSNVLVTVSSVSNYVTTAAYTVPTTPGTNNVNTSGFAYCSASASQLMLVRAVYFAPAWLAYFLPYTVSYNGSTALPLVSTAAFITEPFPPESTTYSGTAPAAC